MSWDDGKGGLPPWVAALVAMRQAGGESTIQEREQITAASRVWLPAQHGLLIMFSFAWTVGGLWLFLSQVAWLNGWAMNLDAFLFLCAGLTVLVVGGYELIKATVASDSATAKMAMGALLIILVGVALSLSFSGERQVPSWRIALIVFGLGSVIAGPLLLYNQYKSLKQPYWRQSPYEQAVMGILSRLFGEDGEGSGEIVLEIRQADGTPIRVNGQVPPIPDNVLEEAQQAVNAEEWPKIVSLDPEVGNLIWFALYVVRLRDLSLESIKLTPAPHLPFKEPDSNKKYRDLYLRKRMIRTLLRRGESRGWWKTQGAGKPAVWIEGGGRVEISAQKVKVAAEARALWRLHMDDSPVPDYWTGSEYETHRVEIARAA